MVCRSWYVESGLQNPMRLGAPLSPAMNPVENFNRVSVSVPRLTSTTTEGVLGVVSPQPDLHMALGPWRREGGLSLRRTWRHEVGPRSQTDPATCREQPLSQSQPYIQKLQDPSDELLQTHACSRCWYHRTRPATPLKADKGLPAHGTADLEAKYLALST